MLKVYKVYAMQVTAPIAPRSTLLKESHKTIERMRSFGHKKKNFPVQVPRAAGEGIQKSRFRGLKGLVIIFFQNLSRGLGPKIRQNLRKFYCVVFPDI